MFSLLPDVVVQFLDGHGKPLAGGLVYTYESGTTTLKPTSTDPDGKTPNTNPIVLDAAGRAKIYLDTGAYRVRVLSRDEVLITDTNQVSRFVNNVELASVLQTVESGLAELEAVRESLEAMVDDVFREQKGYPNGIAPLGGDGKIESGYLPSTPNASTLEKGVAKIATLESAQSSTNDTDIVTPKKLRDALNATDTTPIFAARSFGVFTSTGTILAKGNFSSIFINGTGDYTINLADAMPSENYAVLVSAQHNGGGNLHAPDIRNQTRTSFRVQFNFDQDNRYPAANPAKIMFAIFG